MIAIRRARIGDAPAIGAVHVAAWRSAYPGILPDAYLAGLSVPRQAAHYDHAIRHGAGVHVAVEASGGSDIIGYVTADRARNRALAEGEIETLYVLDDFRDQGVGRRLILAAAAGLKAAGCGSVYVWVLRDNQSRWFYQRLGGRPVAEGSVSVGGAAIAQTAFVWNPIDRLLEASRQVT